MRAVAARKPFSATSRSFNASKQTLELLSQSTILVKGRLRGGMIRYVITSCIKPNTFWHPCLATQPLDNGTGSQISSLTGFSVGS